ncbi:MAG: hypothetical protein AAFP85_07575 [Pseudomonadota bacterium]
MSKHILDRPKDAPKSWLGRAISIEKGARPDPASLALQRRVRGPASNDRVAHYVRIDKDSQGQAE